MALRFTNSFDGYSTSEIDLDWTIAQGNVTIVGTGRHGNGMEFGGGVPTVGLTLDFQPTWICGHAAIWDSSGPPTGFTFLEFLNIAQGLLSVVLRADSILQLSVPSGAVIADSSPFQIHPHIWYYFEVKVTFSDDAGKVRVTAEMRVDGDVKMSGSVRTGINTSSLYMGQAKANRLIYGSLGGPGFATTTIDDLYICDGTTGTDNANNDYQGDIEVVPIFANGDTATADWTLSPATGTGFSKTNEVPPDGDTTYLYSKTTDEKSLFDWEDIPTFTGTIKGVHMRVFARKDDEGSRPLDMYTQPVATDYHQPKQYVNDDYLYYRDIWDGNPETGAAWTRAEFNAAKFGWRTDAP